MSFPAYLAYKDSGIEWIGVTPTHWIISSLKRGFRIEGGSTPSPEEVNWDGDIAWVTPADLSGLKSLALDVSKRTITAAGLASCGTNLLPKGSLILSTRAPIGSLAIALISMCTNQGCKGLVPNTNTSSSYFAYLLIAAKDELNNRGRGTTFLEISGDELSRFDVPMPPFTEQTQIAKFLDHETARIDALIKEQQRLIELLKEKRQAVISHAVTRGLDPAVPMKDSEVEWLGEVPAHWNVIALKWRARIKSGDGISPLLIEADASSEKPIPVVGGNGVMGYTDQCNINPPLVVIGRVGALCGNVHKIYSPAWVSDNALVLEVQSQSLDLDYLAHVLGARNLNEIADKSAQPLITGSKVASQHLPCPSLDEQRTIASFIDSALAKLDELTSVGVHGIALLQERRSALISAAVTGKIDVRGWKPPASAKVQELEEETM